MKQKRLRLMECEAFPDRRLVVGLHPNSLSGRKVVVVVLVGSIRMPGP